MLQYRPWGGGAEGNNTGQKLQATEKRKKKNKRDNSKDRQ